MNESLEKPPGTGSSAAEAPRPAPCADTEYRETLGSLHHFSHLRFAALTLFAGITAAVVSCVFGDALASASLTLRCFFRFAGLAVAVVFLCIEISTSRYIRLLFERASRYEGSHYALLATKARKSRLIRRYAYIALYAVVLLFWVSVICLHPLK